MSNSTALFSLAIALLVGLLLSRLAKKVSLPAVTAYLVAGILIGPYLLGSIVLEPAHLNLGISGEQLDSFKIISDVALGFIAFSMGSEFRLAELKKIGKKALVIGVAQAVVTTVIVDICLIGLHFALGDRLPLSSAIVLGAVATATAPAATLMVVKQYKAKGPLTDILLPVVALDDAVGLFVFAISFGVAKSLGGNIDVTSVVFEPILEVVLSLLLGLIMGLLFTLCERFFHSRSKRMAVSVTFVLMTVGLTTIPPFEVMGVEIAFSSLLACMMLGTVFCNICDLSEELMDRADRWTAPILILFFVISGADLELDKLKDGYIVLVGIIYILARSVGKCLGAYTSAKAVKCEPNIVKYLGITLLPQAGVALGMALKAEELGTVEGAIVSNITLFAVLIYELFGPFLTKIALTKAGDIKPEHKTSARHEAIKALMHKIKHHSGET